MSQGERLKDLCARLYTGSVTGSGPRIALAKNLRGQGSRLSTGQAEGGPHAPEEAAPSYYLMLFDADDDVSTKETICGKRPGAPGTTTIIICTIW